MMGFDLNPIDNAALWFHHISIIGTFASKLKIDNNILHIHSNLVNDYNWNYVMPLGCIDSVTTLALKKQLNKNNAVYLPLVEPKIAYELFECDLCHRYCDSWMNLTRPNRAEKAPNVIINEVKSSADCEMFVRIFHAAFSGTDDFEPYGLLPPEYGTAIRNSFNGHTTNLRHFIATHDEIGPCGCASLSLLPPYAGFYCLGVIPEARRRKVATSLIAHRASIAAASGCNQIILQTEANTLNEIFFSSCGFTQAFRCHCYSTLQS